MPLKPPKPNPVPPKTVYDCGVLDVEATRLDYFRWHYPKHYDCGHYRGHVTQEPGVCWGCAEQARRHRRNWLGLALALFISFVLTLGGLSASCAGGPQ
ncbi:MAG TPA: hypothetical protein VJN18_32295 [Polyangiaceae bacterium]|nr:hypothetical protein [Polyangiaceae bacterium]